MPVIIGEWPIQPHTDINAVCDLIKSWFRVLPGGMFPPPLHVELMNAACECSSFSKRGAPLIIVQRKPKSILIPDWPIYGGLSTIYLKRDSISSNALLST